MRRPLVLDVSDLPAFAFGARASLWWGVWGLIAIEGTMFGLLIGSYFYLRLGTPGWPPGGTPLPGLLAATANVVVLLASLGPMVWAHRSALRRGRLATLAALVLSIVVGVVVLALRTREFVALGCRWDTHAYGSITWTILGMHTGHVIAATVENVLLVALLVNGPVEAKHYVDLETNALYWYFVVAAWLPLYLLVFLGPRIL